MKEVFISYAHDNLNDQEELIKHLSVLKRRGLINDWSDKEIVAGEDWDNTIKTNLDNADIVVFLVSSEFLASDYITNVEVESTIKKYNENEVKVFPVILNHCMWQHTILKDFQAVPMDEGRIKPISAWADKNKAFYTVSIDLMKSIKSELSSDTKINKIYSYKKEISKWKNHSKKNNSSLSLDYIFKILLILFLVFSGIVCFYATLVMAGEINEKLPIIMISFCLLIISMVAYFSWKIIELKQLKAELSS